MDDRRMPTELPDSPPADLIPEIEAAWIRSADFSTDDLHVRVRVGRVTGRVRGDLCCDDLVLARLRPSQFLALACGDPVALRGVR